MTRNLTWRRLNRSGWRRLRAACSCWWRSWCWSGSLSFCIFFQRQSPKVENRNTFRWTVIFSWWCTPHLKVDDCRFTDEWSFTSFSSMTVFLWLVRHLAGKCGSFLLDFILFRRFLEIHTFLKKAVCKCFGKFTACFNKVKAKPKVFLFDKMMDKVPYD